MVSALKRTIADALMQESLHRRPLILQGRTMLMAASVGLVPTSRWSLMITSALLSRLAGGMLLLVSAGTGIIQAGAMSPSKTGFVAALSWAGSLVAFFAACLGILLLVYGPRLRQRWTAGCEAASKARSMMAESRAAQSNPHPEIDPLIFLDPGLGGGRMAMTTYLILRAQRQDGTPKRSRAPHPGERPERPTALHKASM